MTDLTTHGVHWKEYVDRRFVDFGDRMDERFRAQQEAIKVLVDANKQAFVEQGRRLAQFGALLVFIQIVINVFFGFWK